MSMFQDYINQLPDGLESYPDHQQKGSVLRSLLEQWPELPSLAQKLPTPLAHLVTHPPPASLWLPEVQGMALWAFAGDVVCGGDLTRYVEFSRLGNRRLLQKPIYKVVFGALGARLTIRAITAAWATFHKGMTLEATLDDNNGVLILRYPPQLLTPSHADGFGTSFSEGLSVAGFQNCSAVVEEFTPTATRFRCRW